MSDIRQGDIVECIDDVPRRAESETMPVWGQLYSVTAIAPVEGGHSVRLKELLPTCYRGGPCKCGDCGWDAARFRRVLRPDGALIASLLENVDELV